MVGVSFDLDNATRSLVGDLDTLIIVCPHARETLREHLERAYRAGVAEFEVPSAPQPRGVRQPLTARQREAYDFICAFLDRTGYPPTLREIGAHMGIGSTNGVNDHLKALERKGWIERCDLKSRALRPIRER